MELAKILILSIIGEAIWETLKMFWQEGKISKDRIGALVVCIIIVWSTDLDIMTTIGIPVKFKVIGILLTGILISRGSNFIHDLFNSVNNISKK
ncbi:hypothetical protein [Clostridium intestinale]|uniref:Uncharacterized protein n=1 Tax=Clostridium intestinale DSM 6191 TaxID=1121320 RepID=A0A1M5Z1Q7_9CLOT|nr:hypothetical protein [Clostridium intestinale]SHI18064.1 hypothetical protein SAMN02745941_02452 [Clostridium intestinale DSM 6191]